MIWNTQKRFCHLVKTVSLIEQQLQTLRQTLNEQPLFNLYDLFNSIVQEQEINAIDIQMYIKKGQQCSEAIESMIKMYNGNQNMGLTQEQLGRVFLIKKNQVLNRLVKQRPSYGLIEPEINKVCVRILELEVAIHEKIIKFRGCDDVQELVNSLSNSVYLDISKLQTLLQKNNISAQVEYFISYINPISKSYLITIPKVQQFFSQSNCKPIKQFLIQPLPPKNTNPLIDDRFQNLLSTPKTINCFNHRQKRSIESHMTRIKCKRRYEVYDKLGKYRKIIEKQAMALVKAMKNILYLEKQIQYTRMQLSLCSDFYSRIFFESYELDKYSKIIPSTMKYHLDLFNINFELSQIYHLFKRYAGEDGKLTYFQFDSIFTPMQRQFRYITRNPKVSSLNQISPQTKKNYLNVLTKIISNEKEIDSIKVSMFNRQYFDIRNIFNCIDQDEDGCISILDFQVLIKKYANMQLTNLDRQTLAFRFNRQSSQEMISYSEFVLEMAPKSSNTLSKCKSCMVFKQEESKIKF